MKNYLILKYTKYIKEYIFIFLTATIFLFTTFSKSFSEELEEFEEESSISFNGFKTVDLESFLDENISKLKSNSPEATLMEPINAFFARYRDKISNASLSFFAL